MASDGPRYTTTWATTSSSPYDDNSWVNVTNLQSDNATDASITHTSYDAGAFSYLAIGTAFGFSLPNGVRIVGIKVEIEGRYTAGTARIAYVSLRKDGALWGTAKTPAEAITGSNAVYTYGSTTDVWGTTTPTGANINETDFGIAFSVEATGANTDIYFDYARVTVTYVAQLTASAAAGGAVANAAALRELHVLSASAAAATAAANAATLDWESGSATEMTASAAAATAAANEPATRYRYIIGGTGAATAAASGTLFRTALLTASAAAAVAAANEATLGTSAGGETHQASGTASAVAAANAATLLRTTIATASAAAAVAASNEATLLRTISLSASPCNATATASTLTLTKQTKPMTATPAAAEAAAATVILFRKARAPPSVAAAAAAANAATLLRTVPATAAAAAATATPRSPPPSPAPSPRPAPSP